MKKLSFIAILFLVGLFSAFAINNNGPSLKFSKERHDYGTLYSDDIPETKLAIEFSNTGDAPLVLNGVRACCGTRVVSWPREPIMPGQKGTINIEFRLAPRAQRISRTVTVTSNDATNPTSIFRINGQVVTREAEPPK